MGSLETGMVLSDAGGALRLTGVGPSKVTSGWPSDAQVLVGSSEPPIQGLILIGTGVGTQSWGCETLRDTGVGPHRRR